MNIFLGLMSVRKGNCVLKALWIIWSCSSLFCFHSSFGQKGDTLLARQYFEQAKAYQNTGDYLFALDQYKKAKTEYEAVSDWQRVVDCLNELAVCHWSIARYDSTQIYSQESLQMISIHFNQRDNLKRGRALEILSLARRDMGDLDAGFNILREAIEIFKKYDNADSLALARAYQDMGTFFLTQHQYTIALDWLKKAIHHQEKIPSLTKNDLSISYGIISILYSRLGYYNQSNHYAKRAIDKNSIKRKARSARFTALDFLKSMKYDSALKYAKIALDLGKEKHERGYILYYFLVCRSYLALKQYDMVETYLYELVADFESRRNWYSEPTYNAVARLYEQLGNIEKSKEYFFKSLRAADEVKSGLKSNSYYKISSLNHLGDIFYSEPSVALTYYQQAIMANSKSVIDSNDFKLPVVSDVIFKLPIIGSLKGHADALYNIYIKNSDTNLLLTALDDYTLCDSLFYDLMDNINLRDDQLETSGSMSELYDNAIEISLLLFSLTDDTVFLKRAIFFSDRARFGLLSNTTTDRYIKNRIELSNDLQLLERRLLNGRNYNRSVLRAAKSKSISFDHTLLFKTEEELFRINRSYDSLKERIRLRYPEFLEVKRNADRQISVFQRKQIPSNKVILEYHFLDSLGYIFAVSKDTISSYRLHPPFLIGKEINRYRNSIESQQLSMSKKVSYNLYQQLLEPVLKDFDQKELIIIPHGELWHLNFDLLLTEETDSENPKELPYLLKERTVSYANSMSLLFNELNTGNSDLIKETLAFSYSDSSNVNIGQNMSFLALRDAGDDLPGSRKEIANIAEIVDGRYYFGQQSSEKNFKENADKYSILHLALHGELDDHDPQNSKLYFSPSKDSIEDNLLYSFELYNLNIPADLAILSACNTGDGKIAKGEGIMSLGSAFQYAGTKSLVLSSWEVSDDAAPNLMKYFYTNLKSGMNKAEALRQAKLKYLEEAPQALADPFYWGNFYLVGDNSPIEFKEDYNSWVVILSVIAMLIGAFFIVRRVNSH